MHTTGILLSFIGFAGLLYTIICFLRNSKDKNKVAIYSGIIGTIFLIAGIGLVLSSPREENIFIRYGSLNNCRNIVSISSCSSLPGENKLIQNNKIL